MKDEIIVKRYTEAFLGFAKETLRMENALEDLKNFKAMVLRENPSFLEFLESPEIPYTEKCEVIDLVLKEGFSVEFRIFLKLLLKKGRIDKIADIAEYARIWYSHGTKTEALLKTSFPLDLKLIEAIKEKLESKFRKKFKLYIDLDASLLGGLQITIGNKVIDGSVRRRLDELHDKLMSVRIS